MSRSGRSPSTSSKRAAPSSRSAPSDEAHCPSPLPTLRTRSSDWERPARPGSGLPSERGSCSWPVQAGQTRRIPGCSPPCSTDRLTCTPLRDRAIAPRRASSPLHAQPRRLHRPHHPRRDRRRPRKRRAQGAQRGTTTGNRWQIAQTRYGSSGSCRRNPRERCAGDDGSTTLLRQPRRRLRVRSGIPSEAVRPLPVPEGTR